MEHWETEAAVPHTAWARDQGTQLVTGNGDGLQGHSASSAS